LPGEITYLQETLSHYFPHGRGRLVDSFAGLRVLPQGQTSAFHRSRETILYPDNPNEIRLVTIYGGKLTGYRATAAKVVRLLKKTLPLAVPRADTAKLMLLS
ncbi:MAG: FAD-dependent oxidoreductase, partial [Gammaproteobacteria bacterium]|nr:FAD-dependent oxidoreductase [Gammaproteobacteria bacterium]